MFFFVACGDSCGGHSLSYSAVLKEIGFELLDLLTKQIFCLIDKAYCDISYYFALSCLKESSKRIGI